MDCRKGASQHKTELPVVPKAAQGAAEGWGLIFPYPQTRTGFAKHNFSILGKFPSSLMTQSKQTAQLDNSASKPNLSREGLPFLALLLICKQSHRKLLNRQGQVLLSLCLTCLQPPQL